MHLRRFEFTIAFMFIAVFGPFFASLLIAAISIPVIIRVAALKHLTDNPDQDRKLHNGQIPTLGGIAIFGGAVFSFSSFTDYLGLSDIKFMVPSLILLFFAGVKDDILILSPFKKLSVQVICATMITLVGDLRLTSLWGILGITDISWTVGVILTLVAIVGLINAFNLIDGANGLAASLGIVASAFFGSWFYVTDSIFLCILSFSLAGALCGFLYYNMSPAKIFMGDTGSMIIGFIVSLLAIKFVEINRSVAIDPQYYIKAAPGVAMAVLSIPVFDMTRVFLSRILRKRNPFSADRRHIHHILMDIGFSHNQVTLFLVAFTFLALWTSLLLKEWRSIDVALIVAAQYAVVFSGAFFTLKKKALVHNVVPLKKNGL